MILPLPFWFNQLVKTILKIAQVKLTYIQIQTFSKVFISAEFFTVYDNLNPNFSVFFFLGQLMASRIFSPSKKL